MKLEEAVARAGAALANHARSDGSECPCDACAVSRWMVQRSETDDEAQAREENEADRSVWILVDRARVGRQLSIAQVREIAERLQQFRNVVTSDVVTPAAYREKLQQLRRLTK